MCLNTAQHRKVAATQLSNFLFRRVTTQLYKLVIDAVIGCLPLHVAEPNNLPASIMASSSSASKLNSNTALAFAAGAAAAAALVGGIAWWRGSGKEDAEQEEESVRVSKAALARLEAHSAACNRVLDTLFDALDKNGDGGITVRPSVVLYPCSSSDVVLLYISASSLLAIALPIVS